MSKIMKEAMELQEGSATPWISCRFCSLVLQAEGAGVRRILQHEKDLHPDQLDQSSFYRIFQLQELQVDARPGHPLLKTILKLNQIMTKTKKITTAKPSEEPPPAPAPATPAGSGISLPAASSIEEKEIITISDEEEEAPLIITRRSCSEVPPPIPSPAPTLTSSSYNPREQSGASKADRTCEICHRVFKWPCVLRFHIKKSHPDALEEPPAGKETDTDPAHTCVFCRKYFIDPGNLRKHMALHAARGQRGVPCKFCIKQFRNSILLDQHMVECHDKEAPFNCSHCKAKFKSQGECNEHVRVIHSMPTTSGAPTSTPSPSSSSSLTCELCSTICLNKMELISHRAIVHKISSLPFSSNTTSGNISHLVEEATPTPSRPIHLEGEVGDSDPDYLPSPEDEDAEDEEGEGGGGEKDFKCPHCDSSFGSIWGISRHVAWKHKGFPCRFCPKTDYCNKRSRRTHEFSKHKEHWKQLQSGDRAREGRRPSLEAIQGASTSKTSKLASKCRFCSLWFSDRPKRAIHEKRTHTDELATIMLKEKSLQFERENLPAPLGPAPVPTPVITSTAPPQTSQAREEEDSRFLVEEIQVEMKPECLNEYLDESGAPGGAPTPAIGVYNQVSQNPELMSFAHLLSSAQRMPLQTTNPSCGSQQVDMDPLGSSTASSSTTGFWCQFCQQQFSQFLELTVHLDSHSYCATCEQKFVTPQRYRQHLLAEHDRVRKLFCQICCAPFIDLYAYSQHYLQAHGTSSSISISGPPPAASAAPQQQEAPAPSGSTGSGWNFWCHICRKGWATLQALQMHYINDHTDSRLLPVQVPVARQPSHPLQQAPQPPSAYPAQFPSSSVLHQQLSAPPLQYSTVASTSRTLPPAYYAPQGPPQQTSGGGGGSLPFVCEICGLRAVSPSSLLKHKIYVHRYGSTTPSNQQQQQQQTAASGAPPPNQMQMQQQQVQTQGSESLEITQVRITHQTGQNPGGGTNYPQPAGSGGGECVIVEGHRQQQPLQPESVVSQLQRFVQHRQGQQPPNQQSQVSSRLPYVPALPPPPQQQQQTSTYAYAPPAAQVPPSQEQPLGLWCAYCGIGLFCSREELERHCLNQHGIGIHRNFAASVNHHQ